MSKQHFEWAAAYVRHYECGALFRETLTDVFVDLFRHFGPRFDERRFRAACQVPA